MIFVLPGLSVQDYEQTREMIRNKNLEDIHVLQSFLDNTIEDLEHNFETAHLNYLQGTDHRTQQFKKYTSKDNVRSLPGASVAPAAAQLLLSTHMPTQRVCSFVVTTAFLHRR